MIIDAHVHITENGRWFDTDQDASLDGLLKQMANSDVDRAILLPIAPYISNEFIGRVCREHPDKLAGFASVNPNDKNAVDTLEKDVLKYNLRGLKLHPRLQNFRPDDPLCFPIYKKATELGIPILFDTLLNKPTLLKNQVPLLYDEIAKTVPETPIILAHFGGFRFLDALAVAKANPNIYFDISVTLKYFYQTPYQEQLKFVLEEVGYQRLIYGSDYPERDIQSHYLKISEILRVFGIENQDRDKIFSENILKIIKNK